MMTTVRELLARVDTDECIDVLVRLHREDFCYPGYVLSGNEMRKQYQDLVDELLNSPPDLSNQTTIDIEQNTGILTLSINSKPLHAVGKSTQDIASANVNYPRNITKAGVVSELLYELTMSSNLVKT